MKVGKDRAVQQKDPSAFLSSSQKFRMLNEFKAVQTKVR